MMEYVLLATIGLPLVGALLLPLLASWGDGAVRWGALATAVATCLGAFWLVAAFPADGGTGSDLFSVVIPVTTSPFLDVRFEVALDGLSLFLFALSPVLLLSSVLVSWTAITERVSLFFGMLLLLTSGCLGVFAARDLILFYIFFEFTLIPLFFLIGIWGSENRRFAAVKFFLYTLAGSLLTFLGLLSIVSWDFFVGESGALRFQLHELTSSLAIHPMPTNWQCWIFAALLIGFAIKVPLFPLHTWLPLAHVQAPTAGSIFLAGILLKIGTYGFLRFSLPMLPEATALFMPWILWLSVAGIIYGALVALVQSDMKRLIAYSSVSHLGYCMLGIFALNRLGVQGGALQMVNHGISTGALFALVGMLYERYHTREIRQFGGLARKAPWLGAALLLFTFSSIGLPGMNGFVGEFMVLLGMFQRGFGETEGAMAWQFQTMAVLAVTGLFLGAWYMLWLVQRLLFGPLVEPAGDDAASSLTTPLSADLNWREVLSLAPLAVLVFWIGLYPKFFLDRMAPGLNQLTATASESVQALHAPAELRVERSGPIPSHTSWESITRVD